VHCSMLVREWNDVMFLFRTAFAKYDVTCASRALRIGGVGFPASVLVYARMNEHTSCRQGTLVFSPQMDSVENGNIKALYTGTCRKPTPTTNEKPPRTNESTCTYM